MSDLKTAETDADPRAYVEAVEHKGRREDALILLDLFEQWSGWPPRMWGERLIGYGAYDYVYRSGRHARWFRTGFAPRKANLVIYLMPGVKKYADILADLGPYKNSVSCLYLPRLEKIDLNVLEDVVRRSLDDMADIYGPPA
ncbi:DUF1801 domain-containing protein [Pontivivens ytuae]|uniref:DUF1801 domain-containing protein n=1 Tax=Pontivivens ytuae TaxID=2789856 RepID=A0A7S9QC41_9RHOB|nr:DUF1801 domain-containing protein [Pontivivens ytuae]QPH52686.1 DUF1801 domain-containing protein [Pontivivens ytuae]